MKNVFLIPTEKPSRLFLNKVNNKLLIDNDCTLKEVLPSGLYQNIYITSDEEIKEGGYVFWEGKIYTYREFMKMRTPVYTDYFSIILTTDQDLIKDGVQAIDDEFLEWFVKNPSCESVEVKPLLSNNGRALYGYKIIIPQEELKQEIVINEKCSKCGSSQYQIGKPFCTDEFCNTNIGKASEDYWLKQPYNEDAFVEGAKWMAERMYNSLSELRNELYDKLPTGDVDAFELLKLIKIHLQKLDDLCGSK
jgi:hypothetical protein